MQTNILTQVVRCPNCGNAAIRHYYNCSNESISGSRIKELLVHTECPICD